MENIERRWPTIGPGERFQKEPALSYARGLSPDSSMEVLRWSHWLRQASVSNPPAVGQCMLGFPELERSETREQFSLSFQGWGWVSGPHYGYSAMRMRP